MKRREFIILSGIGATSASLLSACGHPEERLIPALIPDDEYIPGIDYWKASTCGMCPAGCGIIVRTREHKANKIEGNQLHPVNRGALCARGQAGLQVLYNPDRIKGPMKRIGERGEGKWEEISWDEAIKTLADKLHEIRRQGDDDSVNYYTNDPSGVNGIAAAQFRLTHGFPKLYQAPVHNLNIVAGYSKSFGKWGVPTFDIANATYLLSFGARFLETWFSPVMYSLAYGEFRRGGRKTRGKFVQIEPRMSLTAANADEWLPAAVDAEDLVALAMAQVIVREGLQKGSVDGWVATELEEYAPGEVAELVDIPAEKITRIAREFASSERPLAIAGESVPSRLATPAKIQAINLLNTLAGNVNKRGGVFLPPDNQFDPLQAFQTQYPFTYSGTEWFEGDWHLGFDTALLIDQINPLYFLPGLDSQFRSLRFIASFSAFMDETTALADLILPDHTYLESWDIRATQAIGESAVATISAAVVKPELNTKQTADVWIALSQEFGRPLPFTSAEDAVRQAIVNLPKLGRAATGEADEFSKNVIERGVWTGGRYEESTASTSQRIEELKRDAQRSFAEAKSNYVKRYKTTDNEFPFALLAYEHTALGFGQHANLPSLQELPDSMTSVMWGSWLEIHPKVAEGFEISTGDLVRIEYGSGAPPRDAHDGNKSAVVAKENELVVPAVLNPALRPDVVAMPYGQGHVSYGRYAKERGVNAVILAPLNPGRQQSQTGSEVIRVKLSKASGNGQLIRFGTDLWQQLERKR